MKEQLSSRQKLIVWVYNLKNSQALKKYGYVIYASTKMNYVVLYVDRQSVEQTMIKLSKLHFVREVEKSPQDNLSLDFSKSFEDYRQEVKAKLAHNHYEGEGNQ